MARKRVVSRTVKMTVANVKAIDAETEQFLSMSFNLTGTFKNDAQVLKACKAKVANPNIQILKVMEVIPKTCFAVMPEEQFLALAIITENNPETEEN